MRAAHAFERRQQVLALDTTRREQFAGRGALLFGEGEQNVLGRDVRIAKGFRILVGPIEDARQFARQRRLNAPRLLGKARDLALGLGLELCDVEPGLLEQRDDNSLVLLQQGIKEMGIVNNRIAFGAR